jgi:membrane protease YdiL (CAAX protease family)
MMPPLFVLAVCFGYVYERTGKLWAPILMHALFNATSITLALFQHA